MDALAEEQRKFAAKSSLSEGLNDIQGIINALERAKQAISADPVHSTLVLAKLQNPVATSFDSINSVLKDVHKGINGYGKALNLVYVMSTRGKVARLTYVQKFKDKPFPTTEDDALMKEKGLVNRAIVMHFLREGQFDVASAFVSDEAAQAPLRQPLQDPTPEVVQSEGLKIQFADMYHILDEMKARKNLIPAMQWARENSVALESRASNFEFELARLHFVWLFSARPHHDDDLIVRQRNAIGYARDEFRNLQGRYLQEIQQLAGAMAFSQNLQNSPYKQIFLNENAWNDVASSFVREFCSLLGLSAESPIYIATTAGAIALPMLQKLESIMKQKRTEWTTQHELPVEIPLPAAYQFHSIFVCPVSKEQTTDDNPPMMMPCGHVIAQESLNRISKVSRFKCPYCPGESHPKEAKKVIL